MSTYTPHTQKYSPSNTTSSVRHSADDALEDRTYHQLLEATYDLGDYYGLEARLILLACGRLALRVGELIHMRADWVDWRRGMIRIPAYEPCTKGKDGGVCGYCRQLAKQRADSNEEMTLDDALRECWRGKTDAAARSVPFDFHPRAEIVVGEYFERFENFQGSKSAVNRRLSKVVEAADVDVDRIYPHALRATAASYHASRGLDAISLQSLCGWAQLGTAHRYVRRSGDRTRRALHATHSR